jgi:hypothetical protein
MQISSVVVISKINVFLSTTVRQVYFISKYTKNCEEYEVNEDFMNKKKCLADHWLTSRVQ